MRTRILHITRDGPERFNNGQEYQTGMCQFWMDKPEWSAQRNVWEGTEHWSLSAGVVHFLWGVFPQPGQHVVLKCELTIFKAKKFTVVKDLQDRFRRSSAVKKGRKRH